MNRSSALSARKAQLGMTVALGAAIALGGALALVTSHTAQGAAVRPEAPAAVALVAPEPEAAESEPPPEPEPALSGSVLETLAVSKYTYLRLATASGEAWAAVPSTTVALGTRVAIANATRMDNFKSATLNRTFEVIYFGTLSSPAAAAAQPKFSAADALDDDEQDLPPGHPDLGASTAPALTGGDGTPLPPGHPDIGALSAPALTGGDGAPLPPGHPDIGASPIGSSQPAFSALEVARAGGENAHDIRELANLRSKLAGQRVRVRGQVTKVTPNVQGHTFFHLRDGKPAAPGPATDLVVTSSLEPQRGQVATFEGVLRADVDIGIGYQYPLLLENAVIVGE